MATLLVVSLSCAFQQLAFTKPLSKMPSSLQNAFRSDRLLYRAIENNEADKDWYHTQIQNDPVGFALGDSNLLRPQIKSRNDEALLDAQKGLLGVMICLPAPTAAEDATPIGILTLNDENGSNYRHHHRLAVLSIAIAPDYQDKGYGGETIRWAVDWAFLRANIHSISLGCVEYNERARHLYEKIGFVLEGRFRKCHFHERKWWDVLLFSMLEEEWEAQRAPQPEAGKGITG